MDKLSEIYGNNCGLKIIIRPHRPFKHYWDKLGVNLGRECCIVKVMELWSPRTFCSPHEKDSDISKLTESLYFIKAWLKV
jgi:hypothetical protein